MQKNQLFKPSRLLSLAAGIMLTASAMAQVPPPPPVHDSWEHYDNPAYNPYNQVQRDENMTQRDERALQGARVKLNQDRSTYNTLINRQRMAEQAGDIGNAQFNNDQANHLYMILQDDQQHVRELQERVNWDRQQDNRDHGRY